jgi:hypothetical protein
MRRLGRTGGAGGAGRARETLQIERDQQGLAARAGKRKIRSIRHPASRVAVDAHVWNSLKKRILQPVAQQADSRAVIGQQRSRAFRGLADSHDARNVFRAGAAAALGMSAPGARRNLAAGADVEGADALRSAKLVRRDR